MLRIESFNPESVLFDVVAKIEALISFLGAAAQAIRRDWPLCRKWAR